MNADYVSNLESEKFPEISNNAPKNEEFIGSNTIKSNDIPIETKISETEIKIKSEIQSQEFESNSEVSSLLYRSNSSSNLFIEIPIENVVKEDSSCSDESIIYSSNKFNETYVTDLQLNHAKQKSKELLTEVSDILLSLSEDERFCECLNFSSNNELRSEDKRNTVDLIFTYNILNILFTKLKQLRNCFENVYEENTKLFKENQKVKAEHDAYQIQVESLEKTIDEQKEEILSLNQKFIDSENCMKEKQANIIDKFESELNSMREKYENAVNEKDAAVMRYAKNEFELISVRKERDSLIKRLKIIENERNDTVKKFNALNNEKNSILQMLNGKKNELNTALRDLETMKEELSCKDIKAKWIEENLKKELDCCKDQCTQMNIKISELEKNTNVNKTRNSETNSDDEAESFHTIFVNGDLAVTKINSNNNSEASVPEESNIIEENNSLALKVQKLETERLDYEKNLMNLKQSTEDQIQKIFELQNQLIEMETLRSTVKEMQDTITSCQGEINRLKETNEDLVQDMESCREREAELLSFTEKLTAKNVILQSENTILEAKKTSLESDRVPFENRITELEEKVISLSTQLKKEIKLRNEDNRISTTQLGQKMREIESLNARLEEQQAEYQSLKNKYLTSMKELKKEVYQYRKYKQFEANENSSNDSVCLDSLTSSCNSLNEQQTIKQIEPDRQTLIERIVKLQKINARNIDKIDFLEEHVTQLLTEVKKKSKVLQYYMIREKSGALSSEFMDQNKAEMSKYGGIMASIYSSKCDENTISLDLSLEINRKLQAVLEDTLLKNIMLKENIETLGKEIARLTVENNPKTS